MKRFITLVIALVTLLSPALNSASARMAYITANYTDTTVTEAGESIPVIFIKKTTGTPGENQYVSDFYGSSKPGDPDTANVYWAKVITEEEATKKDCKIGGKYYRAVFSGVFEAGCTYTQFMDISLRFSDIEDAEELKEVGVTLNGTPSTGLIKITWLSCSEPGYIAYKMLRTVTIDGDVPETGDSTPVALIAGLLLLSGAALVLLKKRGVR